MTPVKFASALLAIGLLAPPQPAIGACAATERPSASRLLFDVQSLALPPASVQDRAAPAGVKRIAHRLSAGLHGRRAISLVLTGAGLGSFLASAWRYKDWAATWTHGSPALEFAAMELISIAAKVLAVVLAQLWEHEGPWRRFRVDGRFLMRSLVFAVVVSAPLEGLYYEYGLALINAQSLHFIMGQSPAAFTKVLVAAFRTVVDQGVSRLWLDGFIIFVMKLFVSQASFHDASAAVRNDTLPFNQRSAWLWGATVAIANLFPRPLINFMVINAGMVLWEILLTQIARKIHAAPPAPTWLQRKLYDQPWRIVYVLSVAKAAFVPVFATMLHVSLGLAWTSGLLIAIPLAILFVDIALMVLPQADVPGSLRRPRSLRVLRRLLSGVGRAGGALSPAAVRVVWLGLVFGASAAASLGAIGKVFDLHVENYSPAEAGRTGRLSGSYRLLDHPRHGLHEFDLQTWKGPEAPELARWLRHDLLDRAPRAMKPEAQALVGKVLDWFGTSGLAVMLTGAQLDLTAYEAEIYSPTHRARLNEQWLGEAAYLSFPSALREADSARAGVVPFHPDFRTRAAA